MDPAGVEPGEKTNINYSFSLFVFEVFNTILFLFALFCLVDLFGCFFSL